MDSRVSPPKQRGRRRWLTLAVEIATVVAALVAIVALLLDHSPFGGDGDGSGGGSAITSTPAGPTTQPPSPAPDGGATPTAVTRFLTDLQPDSGGANVQRVGPHSLRMSCGSGNSTDRDRTVTYLLPAGTAYRSFGTVVSVAGQRDTRIQAFLLIDDQDAGQPVVPAGSTAPLAWHGERAGQLTLRILCDVGATTATFTDPGLSG
jgi:hypothetical protein